MCTLFFAEGNHCKFCLYIRSNFFAKRFYIHKKPKNQSYLHTDFFKPKYWDLSWATKMKSCIFEKFYNSIATKMCANFAKKLCTFYKLLLVHYTIQWLNCVVHYLNIKINWKLVEKINAQLCSALNESVCRKKWTTWAGPSHM